jgi:hypothetical protein
MPAGKTSVSLELLRVQLIMQTFDKVRFVWLLQREQWRCGGFIGAHLKQNRSGRIAVPLQLVPLAACLLLVMEAQALIDHRTGTRVDSRHGCYIEIL